MTTLQTFYREKLRDQLVEKFGYASMMQAPRISKITLNNCFNREEHEDSEIFGDYQDLGLFCDSNVLNVTNVVSFEISDFITKYG